MPLAAISRQALVRVDPGDRTASGRNDEAVSRAVKAIMFCDLIRRTLSSSGLEYRRAVRAAERAAITLVPDVRAAGLDPKPLLDFACKLLAGTDFGRDGGSESWKVAWVTVTAMALLGEPARGSGLPSVRVARRFAAALNKSVRMTSRVLRPDEIGRFLHHFRAIHYWGRELIAIDPSHAVSRVVALFLANGGLEDAAGVAELAARFALERAVPRGGQSDTVAAAESRRPAGKAEREEEAHRVIAASPDILLRELAPHLKCGITAARMTRAWKLRVAKRRLEAAARKTVPLGDWEPETTAVAESPNDAVEQLAREQELDERKDVRRARAHGRARAQEKQA